MLPARSKFHARQEHGLCEVLRGRCAWPGPATPVVSVRHSETSAPPGRLPAGSDRRVDPFDGRDDPYHRVPTRIPGPGVNRRYSGQTVRRALGRCKRGRGIRACGAHPVEPLIPNRGCKVGTCEDRGRDAALMNMVPRRFTRIARGCMAQVQSRGAVGFGRMIRVRGVRMDRRYAGQRQRDQQKQLDEACHVEKSWRNLRLCQVPVFPPVVDEQLSTFGARKWPLGFRACSRVHFPDR